ncbi:MAG TPA: hypothetical protein PKZ01_10515 [Candidatus Hydrogenedentes bacterium]|nr:hypothetical protein [Candidatus Hydrogenedentota bacterium]
MAAQFSVPPAQVDSSKVYWGNVAGFDKPGEVRFDEIVRAAPEYLDMKKKKVEQGSGKYWLLLSQASDRAIRAISDAAQEMEYDFIAAKGYLASLQPPIEADDVTARVIEKLQDKKRGKGRTFKSTKTVAKKAVSNEMREAAAKPEDAVAPAASSGEPAPAASSGGPEGSSIPTEEPVSSASTEKETSEKAPVQEKRGFWGRLKKPKTGDAGAVSGASGG